jgi:hypothetical protein
MTKKTTMSEQPKPDEAVESAAESKLTGAEKRALVARTNAFTDLAKELGKMLTANLALCTGPDGKTVVFQAPVAAAQIIGQIFQQQKQLEISLAVLTDLMLSERHIQAVPFPDTDPEDEKAAPLLAPSRITKEAFWDGCAANASRQASMIRRQILSAGVTAEPGRILKPS